MRQVTIDLDAIRANAAMLADRVAPAKLLAVVKADAYGHGAVEVARALADADIYGFGVVDLAEARELRDAGVTAPILAWIHGPGTDFAWAIEQGIELGIGSVALLEAVARTAETTGRTAIVHLKADTGLSRGGALGEQWEGLVALAARLASEGRIEVRGIWSHLANTSHEADTAQFAAFDRAIDIARAAGIEASVTHIGASAVVWDHPDQARGMIRAGIALYGVSPFEDRTPGELGLRPAMELSAEVVGVKRVPAGRGVSYGHRYVTDRATTLALVPLGYGDGVPRGATGRAEVWINGTTYPIVGTIAMDQFVVDVGDDDVQVGDRAVLFGDPERGYPSVHDLARAAGTIGYEIVTRIAPRPPRRHIP